MNARCTLAFVTAFGLIAWADSASAQRTEPARSRSTPREVNRAAVSAVMLIPELKCGFVQTKPDSSSLSVEAVKSRATGADVYAEYDQTLRIENVGSMTGSEFGAELHIVAKKESGPGAGVQYEWEKEGEIWTVSPGTEVEFVLCCWDVKLSPGVWSMSYTGSVDVYGNVAEADEFNNVCSTNYTLQVLDPDD